MGSGISLRGGITATLNAQTVTQTTEYEIPSTQGQKTNSQKTWVTKALSILFGGIGK